MGDFRLTCRVSRVKGPGPLASCLTRVLCVIWLQPSSFSPTEDSVLRAIAGNVSFWLFLVGVVEVHGSGRETEGTISIAGRTDTVFGLEKVAGLKEREVDAELRTETANSRCQFFVLVRAEEFAIEIVRGITLFEVAAQQTLGFAHFSHLEQKTYESTDVLFGFLAAVQQPHQALDFLRRSRRTGGDPGHELIRNMSRRNLVFASHSPHITLCLTGTRFLDVDTQYPYLETCVHI